MQALLWQLPMLPVMLLLAALRCWQRPMLLPLLLPLLLPVPALPLPPQLRPPQRRLQEGAAGPLQPQPLPVSQMEA
jgi:hypothetical protein